MSYALNVFIEFDTSMCDGLDVSFRWILLLFMHYSEWLSVIFYMST